ncbi:MAG: DUF433 domain-containing protein [Acidobacteria bacterium]|nr:DUF433 domain-containing protein [Acidobacteriota bacterium]
MRNGKKKMITEMVGGEAYEFYPITKHIVVAPKVCGGRPTFKYTRIDVRHALGLLAAGRSIAQVAEGYKIPVKAVQEALSLATKAMEQRGKEIANQA